MTVLRNSHLVKNVGCALALLLARLIPGAVETAHADSYGTGFFITTNGYLVTNNHVVKDADEFYIRFEEEWISAKLIRKDANNDLAILKATGTDFPALPLDFSPNIRPGDTAFTIGFPDPTILGFAPKTTKGEISALSGIKDDVRFYQTTVAIQPGNSGGPLCDENGNVIGVTTSTLNKMNRLQNAGYVPENVNYGLKALYARALIESIPGVLNILPEKRGDLEFRKVQRMVENSVVSIKAREAEPDPPVFTTTYTPPKDTPDMKPPTSVAPERKLMVSYSGDEGVNIRDSRITNSTSNLHGALFQQSTYPLVQIGGIVTDNDSGKEWVNLKVCGWVPVGNKSSTFLTTSGDGYWKVNKTKDSFVAMRTGKASSFPLVCEICFSTVIKEIDRDFSDAYYKYIFAEFSGWAVKKTSKTEYFRYIYD